jgi:Tfp pilus assembly protein FimT
MLGTPMTRRFGFTWIESIVAIEIAGVRLTIAAPPCGDIILVQRLRSVPAQFVTDMPRARSEAASRGGDVQVLIQVPSEGRPGCCSRTCTDSSTDPARRLRTSAGRSASACSPTPAITGVLAC